MLADTLHKLNLLIRSEAGNSCLDDTTQRYLIHGNEAVVVHICEEAHNKLTVHTVSHTTMSWNRVSEVLDLESALKSRSKESPEWCDERGKSCKDQNVKLHGSDRDRLGERKPKWEVISVWEEDRIWGALKTTINVGTKVLQKILVIDGMK